MSMNPDELVSFANMFSNRTGGPSVKKKSAAARQRAKAKGLKNAAYVALGKPAGKKVKRVEKEQGTRTSTNNKSNKTKPSTTLGKSATSPYVSAGVTKSVNDAKAKAAGMKNAAAVALGSPMKKQPSAGSIRAAEYKNAAYVALGSQAKASPKKTTKVTTGNGPSKPRANIW